VNRSRGSWFLLLSVIVFLTGCGRVGDPLPPFIRIPEPATDLRAEQIAGTVRLFWTNPSRYVDQSEATDLAEARIRSGAEVVAEVPVGEPGQTQSVEIEAGDRVGETLEFAIEFVTGEGRSSALSSPASIRVVDVPGAGPEPEVLVNQSRIHLE